MPWTTGQRLQGGKYVIDKVLGQGGFGITYKALHVELNRTVVIKTPNEHLSHDPEYDKYIDRFIQEGRTLARLSQDPHPHIVGVIDLFKEGTIHCLVMDFVPGENLFEAVRRRGALPEIEIVPCIRQIGEALVVVHQAGLVHRDAHPGNIMLRSNGKAVLIDFGIAKELVPQTLSSKGIAGNEGFAPYEQMSRGSREPIVDVYCLAATLYYGVTGQRPTTSLARKLDNAPLTPPKQINSSISDQLNKAILKGMALEAKDRPQSMHAWLAMLEAPKATLKLTILWGCLTSLLVLYGLIGYLLTVSHAPFLTVPWPGAGTWTAVMAVAIAMAGTGAAAGDIIVAGYVWALVLFVVIFLVVIIGRSEAGSGVESVAWAMAWRVSLGFALGGGLVLSFIGAGTGAWGWAGGAMAVVVDVAGAVTGAWDWAKTGNFAGAGAGAVAAVVVLAAGEQLQKSFSNFHTFFILLGTSGIGLVLGWLGQWVFTRP
ncbi:MAG: serine/threonine protein kinase [Nostoc sp. NMS1]|uniref:serine/threonine protein kinase n=1 Tax=unclassified Nostoc TaxID=2593658 RepID=UPI0025F86546|nr:MULTISPECIES: serine/threonine-protein kinase [unclassified Nostoc]MBN3910708.1 serine/threonine protein kinase [Nostoc sp. NMS1]MBN3992774.1 serine/threonine protein kinase [Nostoc sp. NMS2]